jgi:hypothetical protein
MQESKQQLKQELRQLDSYQFEKLVADIWDAKGYNTTVRKASGDRGVDVEAVIKKPIQQKLFIQAKRYKEGNKIGSQKVRKYATLYQQADDIDLVVVVTTSTFTEGAVNLAWDLNVHIVNIDDTIRKIVENNERLNIDHRIKNKSHSIEKSIAPLFDKDRQCDSVNLTAEYTKNTYNIKIRRTKEQFNYDQMFIRIIPKVPVNILTGVGKRSINIREDSTLLEVKISDKEELVDKINEIKNKIY